MIEIEDHCLNLVLRMHAASHGTARFHLPLRARGAAEVAASKRQSSRVRARDAQMIPDVAVRVSLRFEVNGK